MGRNAIIKTDGSLDYDKIGGFDDQIGNLSGLLVNYKNLENYSAYATNIGQSNEDWSPAVDKAMSDLIALNGGVLLVPRMYKINQTLRFGGDIPAQGTYPYREKITIDGKGVGGFLYTGSGTGESFIKLSKPTVALTFDLVFKDLTINANGKNVKSVDGWSDVTSPAQNVVVEFHNVRIIKFAGTGSYGIDCGNMTDCRLFNVIIMGFDNLGTGYRARRSNTKLIECYILYCLYGVVLPSFAEGNMQMIGGGILVCTSHIYIEANGNGSNASYFFGTFIAEVYAGQKIITSQTPDSTDVGSLTFVGCVFNNSDANVPLLNFDFGGRVTLQGCQSWYASSNKTVRKGQYCELLMFGNSGLTYDSANSSQNYMFNRFFRENGDRISAASGFKQLISFKYTGATANMANVTADKNGSLIKSYVMNYTGSILAIGLQISSARTAGTLSANIFKNGVNTNLFAQINATNTQKAIQTYAIDSSVTQFSAGDLITVVISSSSDFAPTPVDVSVDVTIQN